MQNFDTIQEGKAIVKVAVGKISKELPVFYNPIMSLNRTISVLLLNTLSNTKMQLADPLAASGVRAIRFLKELPKNKISSIHINDYSKDAIKSIKENLRLNKISSSKFKLYSQDANIFLLESFGFDYIDIDPFGSPNPFLDSAIKRLARDGILAITATDTAPLSGTFPSTCMRKYWSLPQRNETMHENGLRILIRKVQLVASQYDKALTPIYSYSTEHYMRIFMHCEKGKKKVDKILKQHGNYNNAGPLWLGQLWDTTIAQKIASSAKKLSYINDQEKKFLNTIAQESKIDTVGFYNLPKICKKNKLTIIKQDELIKRIKSAGYKVALTHFTNNSIRSDIPLPELIKIIKN
ncbi:tRNA (guanine(10)-N(2))-dimethyltransferase [Candidatus Woesearchaeota archaeon]|nr:tRNA (guanine(10)-N(2))-dimethyltransferase [Candidatus Woesearchaeota archaeon]